MMGILLLFFLNNEEYEVKNNSLFGVLRLVMGFRFRFDIFFVYNDSRKIR